MSQNLLAEIVQRKQQEIAQLRATGDALKKQAVQRRANAAPHRLRAALEKEEPAIKIIAEFKRKSPSRGVIRDDLSADDAAVAYERGGACAISVLTDKEYFGGSLDDLSAVRARTRCG